MKLWVQMRGCNKTSEILERNATKKCLLLLLVSLSLSSSLSGSLCVAKARFSFTNKRSLSHRKAQQRAALEEEERNETMGNNNELENTVRPVLKLPKYETLYKSFRGVV